MRVYCSLDGEIGALQDGVWSAEDVVQARKLSITMVLGTDMKKHFDIVSRFQVDVQQRTMSNFQVDFVA